MIRLGIIARNESELWHALEDLLFELKHATNGCDMKAQDMGWRYMLTRSEETTEEATE